MKVSKPPSRPYDLSTTACGYRPDRIERCCTNDDPIRKDGLNKKEEGPYSAERSLITDSEDSRPHLEKKTRRLAARPYIGISLYALYFYECLMKGVTYEDVLYHWPWARGPKMIRG
jgi:hypothetical protein